MARIGLFWRGVTSCIVGAVDNMKPNDWGCPQTVRVKERAFDDYLDIAETLAMRGQIMRIVDLHTTVMIALDSEDKICRLYPDEVEIVELVDYSI